MNIYFHVNFMRLLIFIPKCKFLKYNSCESINHDILTLIYYLCKYTTTINLYILILMALIYRDLELEN
jgi:hypothetical protein